MGQLHGHGLVYWGTADGGTIPANWAHDVNLGAKPAGAFNTDVSGLIANTTYYYRSLAQNSAESAWAPGSANFTTSSIPSTHPPAAPTLLSPASGVVLTTLTPILDWNDPAGAVSYGVQVSTVSNFAITVVNQSGLGASTYNAVPGGLNWNTMYYWRVNSINGSGSTLSWLALRIFKAPLH